MNRVTARSVDLALAALAAAFPYPRMSEATEAIYRRHLFALGDADALDSAIANLVKTATRLPPIAVVLEEYVACAKLNQEERTKQGLPEPDPNTPENMRRAIELLRQSEEPGPMTDLVIAQLEKIERRAAEASR